MYHLVQSRPQLQHWGRLARNETRQSLIQESRKENPENVSAQICIGLYLSIRRPTYSLGITLFHALRRLCHNLFRACRPGKHNSWLKVRKKISKAMRIRMREICTTRKHFVPLVPILIAPLSYSGSLPTSPTLTILSLTRFRSTDIAR